MRDLSPVVFLGERSGVLRDTSAKHDSYFFAESFPQAQPYAGDGTEPLCCVIEG